jgi:GntR family transcriptional regulator / MocR family aminotransferase
MAWLTNSQGQDDTHDWQRRVRRQHTAACMTANQRRGGPGGPEIRVLLDASPDHLPLHLQVYRHLREHIMRGALRPGERLPSARTLASDLRVSRNTVEAALSQLTVEGFLERRVGVGTMVAASARDVAPFASHHQEVRPVGRRAERIGRAPLSRRGQQLAALGITEIEHDRGSTPGASDARGFPSDAWQRLLARRARDGGYAMLRSSDAFGVRALRDAIAEYVQLTRGVRCDGSQVVIVSSTQQAIDLACRLLLDPGDGAAIEEPCYPSARAAFLASGATLHHIPVDEDGLQVDGLAARGDVRLVYVTPSHQYPLGVTLSLARRRALLQWADAEQVWILEDDYDSEFRYAGRPIAALQGLDEAGRVLYVGTWNKVLFNGLRLAYLVVPPALVEPFAAARRLTDGFSPPMLQAVLADFLTGGHFAAYLRQARAHFEQCRDALVQAVSREWGEAARIGPCDTGLHLVVHLSDEVDDTRLARRAVGHGLGVTPLSRHYAERTSARGLLLSYGGATPSSIVRGVAALAPRIREAAARRP